MSASRPFTVALVGLTLASSAWAAPPERRAAGEDPAARSRMWAQRLHQLEPKVRSEASWNLLALAPASLPPVLEILREPRTRAEIMISAARLAGELGAPEAVGPLRDLVHDPDQKLAVRHTALVALAKLRSPDALSALVEVADGDDPLLRTLAVVALGMIEAPEAGRTARAAIEAPEPLVRRAGFRALSFVPDARSIPACLQAIQADSSPAVRAEAGRALGAIGDARTLDRLEEVVARLEPGALRWLLLEAMAQLGHQKAIEYFLGVLGDRRSELVGSAATVLFEIREPRAKAAFRAVLEGSLRGAYQPGADELVAYALGVLGDAEAVPVLVRALEKGRPAVRREAARSLGRLRAPQATRALLAAANTPDRTVRAAVLVALAAIGDEAAWKPVGRTIRDQDAFVRYAAAVALEGTGNPRAVRLLRRLLDDPHDFVQAAAADAIALLEGKAEPLADDPRQATHLSRLRSLDREYTLRFLSDGLTASVDPAAGVWVEQVRAGDIIGWEIYTSTCGGTHPPVETYRAPVFATEDYEVVHGDVERRQDARLLADLYIKQLDEDYRLTELRTRAEELKRERRHGDPTEPRGPTGGARGAAAADR